MLIKVSSINFLINKEIGEKEKSSPRPRTLIASRDPPTPDVPVVDW